jgi:hypothetical protein
MTGAGDATTPPLDEREHPFLLVSAEQYAALRERITEGFVGPPVSYACGDS